MTATRRARGRSLAAIPAAPAPSAPSAIPAIRASLLAWYDVAARDLPWRRTRDPYAIWVAEIMLQQTRVETVRPYYARFLERFPSVRALAGAKLDDVLAAWSGLGYYRRARMLHAGAQHVAEAHAGVVPADVEALRAIPGVGPYTTGAIGSQAFDLEAPLVDGNVARVLSRVFAIEQDVKRGEGLARAWALAAELVPGPRPGALNNALMELGATVCAPREPRCEACPLTFACVARSTGRERELPVVTAKGARPRIAEIAVVLRVARGGDDDGDDAADSAGAVLMGRCAANGLFAGLWEPLRVAARDPYAATSMLEAMLGVKVTLAREPVREVEHVLTHRVIALRVYEGTVARAPARDARSLTRAIDGGSEAARYDAVELVSVARGEGAGALGMGGGLEGKGVAALAWKILGARATRAKAQRPKRVARSR